MKSSKTNATIHYKLVTFKVYVPLKFPRGVNGPFSESQIHHIGYISGYIPILSPKVVGVNPHFSWRSSRWITSWAVFNMLIEYWLVLWNHGIFFMTFHWVGNVKIPTDELTPWFLQRGRLDSTPNQSQPASRRGMNFVWASFFSMKSHQTPNPMKSHGKFMKVHRKKSHQNFIRSLSSRLANKNQGDYWLCPDDFLGAEWTRRDMAACWNHLVSWVFWCILDMVSCLKIV